MMSKPVDKKPELLLPAGDQMSVTAAVQNGADAVYLGGQSFSARQNAPNFTPEELRQALQYCHTRGVKVYQTLNTLVFDSQFSEVLATVEIGCSLGMDAFIVQDWGILRLLREHCPGMRIHASTQMTVHSPRGLCLLEEAGVKRAVLARELSLEEIREITRSTSMEIEVFAHGALCMSVSGQCYMSSMIGGRSGNRGACAGTCRLPWTTGGALPDPERDYGLSLKDLCLAQELSALTEAGIASLKVEGRMKRPEYVAAAARAYRAGLDSGKVPDEELDTLQAVFSRGGFTDGYFTGKRENMFGYRQKKDVVAATPKILKTIENTYKKEHGRVPLSLFLTARAGIPLRLTAHDRDGHCTEVTGSIPEAAANKPSTPEGVIASLQKLGGTIFCPEQPDTGMSIENPLRHGIGAEVEDGLFLPASVLNELRREVCSRLALQRAELHTVEFHVEERITGVHQGTLPNPSAISGGSWARFAQFYQIPFDWIQSKELTDSASTLQEGKESGKLSRFSLPLEEITAHLTALLPFRDRLLMEPDRLLFGREEAVFKLLKELRDQGFRAMLCNNIAHLEMARSLSLEAYGGPFLNAVNSRSVEMLAEWGAVSQILSFEMNLQDALRVRDTLPLGLISYGFLPLMAVRNCPVKNQTSCQGCRGSGTLTDRTGMRFPVVCGQKRYAEVLNGNVLWLADRQREFERFSFRVLYFTTESQEDCREVLDRYQTNAAASGKFTRGLYYRTI